MDANSTVQLHTGSKMPVFGLGTWQLLKNTTEIVEYAIGLGYSLIDTSSDYGTQPGIGKAIKNTSVSRKDLYIVTKVEETDNAYERTLQNLDKLQLNYVDLTLIHRPPPTGAGEELWHGLLKAKHEGLTRDIGVSNYPAQLTDVLIEASGETPTVNQIEWSPFGYSDEMMAYCKSKKIAIQAYSPLTRGKRVDDEILNQVAQKYAKSAAQVLLRWNLQSGTYPIPKANEKDHLDENINVFDFELASEDVATLDRLNEGYSTFGPPLPYMS